MADLNMTPTKYASKLMEEGLSPEEVRSRFRQERVEFPSFTGVLNELLGKKGMSVDVLADLSGINPASIYRFMNKERNPTRNAIIRMAYAMELSLEETQVLLKSANLSTLSGTRDRDLIIMAGIINKNFIVDINQKLIDKGMTGLNTRI